ncbi:NAD-dependent epimerase/dehydratase family protein [Amycolatopsis sp. NPDC088138]|uniref:NAD-dependent epimerase/dehydratase family protein n=1 Tax=Amycolatopsis sp. NPDC088138 TaxID=3363938 RepID=UPI003822F4E8
MSTVEKVLVTGAGGFIAGHLISQIHQRWGTAHIVALDRKPTNLWSQLHPYCSIVIEDLTSQSNRQIVEDFDVVFHLAADAGGMPFISTNNYNCMKDIASTQLIIDSALAGTIGKIVFTSSACVYPESRQGDSPTPLQELSALPAEPDSGYGWAKLYCERMGNYAKFESGIKFRSARLFNVYGTMCSTGEPREKAPAAIARKILHSQHLGLNSTTLLGTGKEVRSFLHVSDCTEGLLRLAEDSSNISAINFASLDCITVNELAEMIALICNYKGTFQFNSRHTGVSTRIPCIKLAKKALNWSPSKPLNDGLNELVSYIRSTIRNT